jgi:hypothetical protein
MADSKNRPPCRKLEVAAGEARLSHDASAGLQADLKVRLYVQASLVRPPEGGPHDCTFSEPTSAAACAVVRRDQMKGPSLDQLG